MSRIYTSEEITPQDKKRINDLLSILKEIKKNLKNGKTEEISPLVEKMQQINIALNITAISVGIQYVSNSLREVQGNPLDNGFRNWATSELENAITSIRDYVD